MNMEAELWKETAAQYLRNSEYYASLLDEIATNFGLESYRSDDGTIQGSPLRAKMPGLVKELFEIAKLPEWALEMRNTTVCLPKQLGRPKRMLRIGG